MVDVPGALNLGWYSPTSGDVEDLQAFCRTKPDRRVFKLGKRTHPTEWELEAQSAIRDLRPPLNPPNFGIIARDQAGIAAAAVFEVDLGPIRDVALVWIFSAAVKISLRGRGIGQDLLSGVADRANERAR